MRTPASAVLSGIKFVFWFITGLAFIATVLGFGGHWMWQFELASHFRLQYFVILLVASLILLVLRHYWKSALAGVFALVNLSFLVPLYIPSSAIVEDVQNLRVISINVQSRNHQRKELFKLVHDSSPDFLVLFEVDKSWSAATRELAQSFRYSRISATGGNFASAIFSQYPIKNAEFKKFSRVSHYALVASLDVEGQPFHIIAAHILAPTKNAYFLMRNDHLDSLASTSRLLQGPVMLIGDLNLSPWSPYFDDLIDASGLRDSRIGFGIRTTWPVKFPLLRIPIDHCLVSPSISISKWVRGPDIGSDHFPIIIDFAIGGSGYLN